MNKSVRVFVVGLVIVSLYGIGLIIWTLMGLR